MDIKKYSTLIYCKLLWNNLLDNTSMLKYIKISGISLRLPTPK